MTSDEVRSLKSRDEIRVRFGRSGEQQAVVHSVLADSCGQVEIRVRKFRMRSQSWTRPVRVVPDEVLRRQDLGEVPRELLGWPKPPF